MLRRPLSLLLLLGAPVLASPLTAARGEDLERLISVPPPALASEPVEVAPVRWRSRDTEPAPESIAAEPIPGPGVPAPIDASPYAPRCGRTVIYSTSSCGGCGECGECDEMSATGPGGYGRFLSSECRPPSWSRPLRLRAMPPPGASLYGVMSIQVSNGQGALMTLYAYDFLPDQPQLNRKGKERICRIAGALPTNGYPVVIEPSHDPFLDEARREAVIQALAAHPFPVPDERIVIGTPLTRGLDGVDAELVHSNLLRMTGMGRPAAGVASSSTGPTSVAPTTSP